MAWGFVRIRAVKGTSIFQLTQMLPPEDFPTSLRPLAEGRSLGGDAFALGYIFGYGPAKAGVNLRKIVLLPSIGTGISLTVRHWTIGKMRHLLLMVKMWFTGQIHCSMFPEYCYRLRLFSCIAAVKKLSLHFAGKPGMKSTLNHKLRPKATSGFRKNSPGGVYHLHGLNSIVF